MARSPFVLKHITSWRASEASETVLGVVNAKSGICSKYIYIYVWIVRMPLKGARGDFVFLQKIGFWGLTPVFLDTTTLSKSYFIFVSKTVKKLRQKRLFLKSPKLLPLVTTTSTTPYHPNSKRKQKKLPLLGAAKRRLLVFREILVVKIPYS